MKAKKPNVPSERVVKAQFKSSDSPPVALGITPSGVQIAIKYMGGIERGARFRWVDGYSVFMDGRQTQPWLTFREAMRYARELLNASAR